MAEPKQGRRIDDMSAEEVKQFWHGFCERKGIDAATRARWEAAIEAFFLTRTREEIATEGRRRGINATVIATPADVRGDAHLAFVKPIRPFTHGASLRHDHEVRAAEVLRAYGREGIGHVQLVIDPITRSSIEAFAPVLARLDA